jgi:hypothetical protein
VQFGGVFLSAHPINQYLKAGSWIAAHQANPVSGLKEASKAVTVVLNNPKSQY